jgi:hypothetical protein
MGLQSIMLCTFSLPLAIKVIWEGPFAVLTLMFYTECMDVIEILDPERQIQVRLYLFYMSSSW